LTVAPAQLCLASLSPARELPEEGGGYETIILLEAFLGYDFFIYRRLTAQAGGAPPLPGAPPQPRLGGVGSGAPPGAQDSVAATIAAAKAIAARMGGGGSVLNNEAPKSGGQWAWGKG
jgi:hypothetical protein